MKAIILIITIVVIAISISSAAALNIQPKTELIIVTTIPYRPGILVVNQTSLYDSASIDSANILQ